MIEHSLASTGWRNELRLTSLVNLPYEEFGSINHLCHATDRRNSAFKNSAFQFNYSVKQGKIYIILPIDNEKVIINDSSKDVLCFKQNIIIGRSAGSNSGMDRVIFTDYPPGFS